MTAETAYSSLPDSETSLSSVGVRRSRWTWHWTVHIASTMVIVILAGCLVYRQQQLAPICWERHHYDSPVNEALSHRPYVKTRFNGSLWYESPYKGPPNRAVEEAWHAVMQYGIIAVTSGDYEKAGHSVRTAVKFPEDMGGGFMATTVGTHQLHCLHYLWQDHHRAYFADMERKAKAVPDMYERHFEHCVDYIRQSLMCHYDTALVTYDWVGQHQNPTPNANAMHKCVDWEAVQAWLQDRAVEMPEGFEWKQPLGQESLSWNP